MGRMRKFLGVASLAGVLAVGWLPGPAAAEEELTFSYVAAGDVASESPLGCVMQRFAEGVDLRRAIEECRLTGFGDPEMPRRHMLLGPAGGSSGGSFHGTVNCNSGNPQLGEDGGFQWGRGSEGWWYYGKDNYRDEYEAPGREPAVGVWKDPEYQRLADEADRQWAEYIAAIKDGAHNDTAGEDPEKDKALWDAWKEKEAEANEAMKKRDAWRPPMVEGDGTGGDDDGTAVARPGRDSACAELAALVADCNAHQWQSQECQQALERMTNCNRLVAMPGPDQTDPCGEQDIPDGKTAQQIATLICGMSIKPEPGADPCGGIRTEGQVLHGYLPTKEGGAPCGSPWALTTGEDCTPTITVVGVNELWRERVRELLAGLGGKGFIIHLPEPYPVLGPNDPRTCTPFC